MKKKTVGWGDAGRVSPEFFRTLEFFWSAQACLRFSAGVPAGL
jgi:hypothetical protein